jgi:hypothetical protein
MGDVRLATLRETEPNTALGLHPAWTLTAGQRLETERLRSRDGTLYGYRWGTHAALQVPLSFVADAERALLHAWWSGQERLLFTLDSSAARSHAVCRIVNGDTPLGLRVPSLGDAWAGLLELEAVDGRLRLGLPFILDDPLNGRLDQPHLSLL